MLITVVVCLLQDAFLHVRRQLIAGSTVNQCHFMVSADLIQRDAIRLILTHTYMHKNSFTLPTDISRIYV